MSLLQARQPNKVLAETEQLKWPDREDYWIVIGVAHIVLGILMGFSSLLSTIHAIATILIGFDAVYSKRKPEYVLQIVAYIVGVEVLWRVTEARVLWEAGKYFIIFLLVVYMMRERQLTIPMLPLMFFLLLLPSGCWRA